MPTSAPALVRYCVARTNAVYPMGTPLHPGCLREMHHRTAWLRRNFSFGEIDPAELAGKRCGYCGDDWREGPKHMEPLQEAPHRSCLNCSSGEQVLAMDTPIAVGFGMAELTCDGGCVIDGEAFYRDEGIYYLVCDAEELAAADPDHDWRIELHGPGGGRVYQRHDAGRWVYVKRIPGFID
jgi:hypothetical protein